MIITTEQFRADFIRELFTEYESGEEYPLLFDVIRRTNSQEKYEEYVKNLVTEIINKMSTKELCEMHEDFIEEYNYGGIAFPKTSTVSVILPENSTTRTLFGNNE